MTVYFISFAILPELIYEEKDKTIPANDKMRMIMPTVWFNINIPLLLNQRRIFDTIYVIINHHTMAPVAIPHSP